VISIIHNNDRVRVLRVRDFDDYEAIRVQLGDGREGYIFCCENFGLSR